MPGGQTIPNEEFKSFRRKSDLKFERENVKLRIDLISDIENLRSLSMLVSRFIEYERRKQRLKEGANQ